VGVTAADVPIVDGSLTEAYIDEPDNFTADLRRGRGRRFRAWRSVRTSRRQQDDRGRRRQLTLRYANASISGGGFKYINDFSAGGTVVQAYRPRERLR
jgi:hypothetical protein